jgi:ATP sulfurylase
VSDQDNEVAAALAALNAKVQILLDKQDELGINIAKIKEAVYNPDKGLYARLTKLDARLAALENWKGNNVRLMWIVVSAVTGLAITAVWNNIL